MNHPIIILLVLVIALYLMYSFTRWRKGQSQATLQKNITRVAIYVGIALLVLLAATGRLHWLFAVIASLAGALIPLLRRSLPFLVRYLPFLAGLYRQAKAKNSASSPTSGQQSKVETRFLRMSLDHDSGDMSGEVLEGDFQGNKLEDLSLEQLIALLSECRQNDPDAAPLLEAYLDRMHQADWREAYHEQGQNQTNNQPNSDKMTAQEAYDILGLKQNATPQEVTEAHRRLMQKLHPDRGGSTYLAAKINQAKDTLLEQ